MDGIFLPFAELDHKDISLDENYKLLYRLWKFYRLHTDLLDNAAKTNEYDLLKLKSKFADQNVATARLGYLLAVDYLEDLHSGAVKSTAKEKNAGKQRIQTSRGTRVSYSSEYYKQLNLEDKLSDQISRLKEAGELLLLDRTFHVEHISQYAEEDHEELLWKKVLENMKKNTKSLLTAKVEGERVIDRLAKISEIRIIDKDGFEDVLDDVLNVDLDPAVEEQMDEFFSKAENEQLLENVERYKYFLSADTIDEKKRYFEEVDQ